MGVFLTNVEHCRAKVHSFKYKTVSVLLDLDNLDQPDELKKDELKDIGYNKHSAFSVWDKDYLPGKIGSIKQKFLSYLQSKNIDLDWKKIELLTSPKFLGYAFNPVSFYLCYKTEESELPDLLVAEVNNTFGETHIYFASREESQKNKKFAKYKAKKEFHVSPFYDLKGNYEFFVSKRDNELEVKIHLEKEGKTVFTSSIAGTAKRQESYLKAFLWGVQYSWLTVPRISFNAGILYFQKKLKVFSKPAPSSKWTIGRKEPSYLELIAKKVILKYLNRIEKGSIVINLPNSDVTGEQSILIGDENHSHKAVLDIKDWSFFTRVMFGGDVAFGECYVDKIIDTPDLTTLLGLFSINQESIDDRSMLSSKISQLVNTIKHKLKANTLRGSKQNISAHYDLGNKLYKNFLDPNLVYSSASFDSEHKSLEQAQLNKLKKMLKRSGLDSAGGLEGGGSLLEIGSGWGALAVLASEKAKVTTITLSNEQLDYVNQKITELGLEDRITAKLCDYRNVEGQFDSIISIEMLEAVGHENLEIFFKKCHSVLKTKGKLAIQVITFPDARYKQYRTSCDWIQKYIFPGGLCPSLGAINKASSKYFNIENSENLAKSYAETLRVWRENFNNSWEEISKEGYDEKFQRMWNYYLCYCEAGFDYDVLGTYQIEMTKI